MKWARRYCYWILPGAAIYGLWTRENIGRYLFASGLALGGIILCVYAGYQDLVLDLNPREACLQALIVFLLS